MNKFTVLLLRPDYAADTYGQDTYLAQVEAEDAEEAVLEARADAMVGDGYHAAQEDYYPLITLAGWHDDLTRRP